MRSLLPIIDAGLPTGVVPPFQQTMATVGPPLTRRAITELQINLGKLCNQTCTHCHVEAGPTKKRENMGAETADRIIELSRSCQSLNTVDLTGGAPEMNPHFRRLVESFRSRGIRVIDRCNLTILSQPGYEWAADFLAQHNVDVVASLPCYLEDNVDGQRGDGVFLKSIAGLHQLNALGYGKGDPQRRLDLVFNPTGPSLPPDQHSLETDYKRELKQRFDIDFDHLLCITNIPIKRYATYLAKRGKLDDYMRLLADNFNPAAAEQVMCRSLVSISWDGQIFDCDFNQMLEIPISGGTPTTIWDVESIQDFVDRPIAIADHCYGCTAGAGSSCGGAVIT
ncbi:molybdenum cofactor biosynthesis protein A [Rubripirellula lacrimiformis]|uniref:Molybdenum cofactor biosynthesis protein A n=1 Tax=Rubripirellula lacrimiformis TaxID=1930273 RepID=A0A517N6C9_9BACT|nr:arsenosugar biosynthesis radical SAM (seleno)protein ArsS [Rubripirellula lacrimiformis]QDT02696.1 molybdenum cofactor biosynthesis protein A [Rubripirellula lacrimiformis]